jgi:3-oxoacyl-[acyl-carrier-protein] synthase II
MTRRVVVTGIGSVTPFGDLAHTIEAIDAGRSAIGPVRAFDAASFVGSRGAECRTFDPLPWFRQSKTLKLADRRTRLAVAAAGMAVAMSALASTEQAGVVIGTSGSDLQTEDCGRAVGSPSDGDVCDIDYFGGRILRKLNPLWLLVNLANMASAHVAIQLDAHGPNSTITTDWIAGLQAIGEASRWIAHGEADVVIAGGADCGVLPFVYASLEASGILGNGFVPGEGAAMFVLEPLERARARGARVLAEVTGYASSALVDSTEATMRRALAEGGSEDFREVDDLHSQMGHALAAAAPIALAVALGRLCSGPLVVNARGAMGQSAAIVVVGGDVESLARERSA